MDACLAAVIAFGLDDMRRVRAGNQPDGSLRRRWTQQRKASVFVGLTLVVLIATQLPLWPYVTPTAVGLPANVRRAIPSGDPVALTYPFSYGYAFAQPMLWQAEDGFGFRILGGYAYHPTSSGSGSTLPNPMSPPGLQQFLFEREYFPNHMPSSQISAELVAATRTALRNYHVRLVIVDRSTAGSGPVMGLFTDALGPPSSSAGHISIWTDWHRALGQ
jgi:hypothetical protein